MLTAYITRIVAFCAGRPWSVIVLSAVLTVGAGLYIKQHFAIHTNIEDLISPDLPWARRGQQFAKDFPERDILVVLDAPTPELVDQAAAKMLAALQERTDLFHNVSQPGAGSFFEQNGLLFLSTDDVRSFTQGLSRADALVGTLASDPSLRGAVDALSLVTTGVQRGDVQLDDVARALNMAADTAEAVLAARPASFSWQVLASGKSPTPSDLRRFIQVAPVLDFNSLEPGRAATDTIALLASQLGLERDTQTRVRQTGRVPIDDDEFATIREHAGRNAAISILAVIVILWLALRSFRIIAAVVLSIMVGFAVALAVGLGLVGAFNLISIAFFALFVGLGIDFGIQFSVRYRAERHDHPDLQTALRSAARKAAVPLCLAAIATAVGFSSFLPTPYRGLSELGEIAGAGMIIAFIGSITLLPAVLAILKPPPEKRPVGFAALAPLDRLLLRHRIPIVVTTIAVVTLASPLLFFLRFDFDPNHLRSSTVQSVAIYLELRSDPQTGANAVDVVEANLASADATAKRLSSLPQVRQAKTLSNFVPDGQDEKLKLIHEAVASIAPSLNPDELETPPSDKDIVDDLKATSAELVKVAAKKQGSGAQAATRLSQRLSELAVADQSVRARAADAIVPPLWLSLDHLRSLLKAQRVSVETIPPELAREWVTSDGRARIELLAKGDPDDTDTLRNFVSAVLAVEPNATGPAVLLFEAGNTVVGAFIEAGVLAICAIAVLLLIVLRRVGDVLLTLVPLLLAGVVTLELCVVFGMALNFANVIALPLLLGVGVAFKIYYIEAWRAGKINLLESSLTRAVIFSAMTSATAFGTLWLSSHPGTSSMGKLMALALVCTMAAAVLFQPVLMGPPREKSKSQIASK
jgi:hopanoid biosynthesis associated RND transporter like protein HpnN